MSRSKGPVAIELVTERFVLKPISANELARQTFHWTEDRASFADLAWRTSGWTLWRWWRHLRRQNRRNRLSHSIWPKGAAAPIGFHLIGRDPSTNNFSVGVLVGDRSWWGKGVVAEVRTAILADCFERLNANRVSGTVNGRNFASIYNYQRLGFVREGITRESFMMLDGSRVDQLLFGMLRHEWLALKAGREPEKTSHEPS
jgi:RimJ/RimL family protein N-acetyltransferase